MNTVDKVINMAKSQVGYMEKSRGAYLYDNDVLYKFTEGAGSDNYTKYGKMMHDIYPKVIDFPAPWCDVFVDAIFTECFGVANAKGLLGDFDDYTVGSANLYKKMGAYHKAPCVPEIGDQIFFKNDKRICHTGLVVRVDDKRVYTIEGNTSNGSTLVPNGGMVCEKSYPLNYDRIDGYGRPKYDKEAKDGWVGDGKNWYFYRNGKKVKREFIKYDHHWYRLGIEGEMLVGWHQIYDSNNKLQWIYLEEEGEFKGCQWISDAYGYMKRWTTED